MGSHPFSSCQYLSTTYLLSVSWKTFFFFLEKTFNHNSRIFSPKSLSLLFVGPRTHFSLWQWVLHLCKIKELNMMNYIFNNELHYLKTSLKPWHILLFFILLIVLLGIVEPSVTIENNILHLYNWRTLSN